MPEKVVPCLMCDTPVVVEQERWEATEAPFALCEGCETLVHRGQVAWPMVKMLYVIRCQVSAMLNKMSEVELNIRRLFAAQKDLEQDLLRG